MFEKREYVPYEKTVTITEHRAPTDESVKILAELEKAAAERVIARVPLESAWFKAEVMFCSDMERNQLVATARVRINEKEIRVSSDLGRVPEMGNQWDWTCGALDKLTGELAKEIAKEILLEEFAIASAKALVMARA